MFYLFTSPTSFELCVLPHVPLVVPHTSKAHVPCVLSVLSWFTELVPYVFLRFTFLVSYVLPCLTFLVHCIPSCLTWLLLCAFSCFTCFVFCVPFFCISCSRVLRVPRVSCFVCLACQSPLSCLFFPCLTQLFLFTSNL